MIKATKYCSLETLISMKVRLDSRKSEAYWSGGLRRRFTMKPFSSDRSMSTEIIGGSSRMFGEG